MDQYDSVDSSDPSLGFSVHAEYISVRSQFSLQQRAAVALMVSENENN